MTPAVVRCVAAAIRQTHSDNTWRTYVHKINKTTRSSANVRARTAIVTTRRPTTGQRATAATVMRQSHVLVQSVCDLCENKYLLIAAARTMFAICRRNKPGRFSRLFRAVSHSQLPIMYSRGIMSAAHIFRARHSSE